MKTLLYLIEVVAIIGYLAMALLTGASRPRDCAPGDPYSPKPEIAYVSTAMGLAWPYTLYQYYQKTGTTERFFHRTGVLCGTPTP